MNTPKLVMIFLYVKQKNLGCVSIQFWRFENVTLIDKPNLVLDEVWVWRILRDVNKESCFHKLLPFWHRLNRIRLQGMGAIPSKGVAANSTCSCVSTKPVKTLTSVASNEVSAIPVIGGTIVVNYPFVAFVDILTHTKLQTHK